MCYWEIGMNMSKKFRLTKYKADKNKSYEFCQERKTIEDETDAVFQQGKRIVGNLMSSVNGSIDLGLIHKSTNCPKLDVLDCCGISIHMRVRPECKVCVGNV